MKQLIAFINTYIIFLTINFIIVFATKDTTPFIFIIGQLGSLSITYFFAENLYNHILNKLEWKK